MRDQLDKAVERRHAGMFGANMNRQVSELWTEAQALRDDNARDQWVSELSKEERVRLETAIRSVYDDIAPKIHAWMQGAHEALLATLGPLVTWWEALPMDVRRELMSWAAPSGRED